MKPLNGRVALVTGAGKNIGRAIALRLSSEGATVAVNGRSDRASVESVVDEIRILGGSAFVVMGDVSREQDVRSIIQTTVDQGAGLDIVVSNAGLRRKTAFLDMSFEEWRETLSVALDGAFLLAQAAAPHLIERGAGAFIALSGISTHVGTPNRCHVSASKAGLEGFVRAIARELAPHRITCNCIAPGAIDTERGASAGGEAANTPPNIPLARRGTAEEIAALAAFLAGPEGSYVTGQTIHINGGAYLT